jgi:hypothetical protein
VQGRQQCGGDGYQGDVENRLTTLLVAGVTRTWQSKRSRVTEKQLLSQVCLEEVIVGFLFIFW